MIELLRPPHPLDLAALDPAATPGFEGGKKDGERALAAGAPELGVLQEQLYADAGAGGRRSVLLVLQAMDTAGKGGIVRHVMGSMSPYGVQLRTFMAPTMEERRHDFLWRIRAALPSPGHIGVFDRSHYEDVLVQKVRSFAPAEEIERRYAAIADFEREVVASGTAIVKVMLHISPAEQKARLAARLDDPAKLWKYNPGDLDDRALWPQYMDAYRIAIERTDTDAAPWHVVPADRKWYARLAVQRILAHSLRGLGLNWPEPDFDVAAERARLASA